LLAVVDVMEVLATADEEAGPATAMTEQDALDWISLVLAGNVAEPPWAFAVGAPWFIDLAPG